MAVEIERKFLVISDEWKNHGIAVFYRQGYLSIAKERTIRVRTINDKGFLTIKGIRTGLSRVEYEYVIPIEDAIQMLDTLCEYPIITKHRTKVEFEGLIWEIDEFHGDNEGLVVAEVEIENEDQKIVLPHWIGEEVSYNPKYSNSNLTKFPFNKWI